MTELMLGLVSILMLVCRSVSETGNSTNDSKPKKSHVFASAVPKVQQMQQNPPTLSQAHLPVILSCSFGGALVLLIVTRIWMYYRQHLKAAPNLLRVDGEDPADNLGHDPEEAFLTGVDGEDPADNLGHDPEEAFLTGVDGEDPADNLGHDPEEAFLTGKIASYKYRCVVPPEPVTPMVESTRIASEDETHYVQVHNVRTLGVNPRTAEEEERLNKQKRFEEALYLKEKLNDWLSRCMVASGVDVDDQKLTIFIPEVGKDSLEKSLQEELQNVDPDLCHCYKITPISEPFTIQRETQKAGVGSPIFYLTENGPQTVTLGALFVNILDNQMYVLSTSHLDDVKGKMFHYKNNEGNFPLGKCVAFICQTNPIIEACLIELISDIEDVCSPLISREDETAMAAYSGPYRGSLLELLAAPKEVMKCGGSSGITRGKMKYFAYDFPDPDRRTMINGGIVTFPVDHSTPFCQPGDSGSILSIASCQTYWVDNWGIDCNPSNLVERHARPRRFSAKNTIPKTVIDGSVQEQTVPKTIHTDEQVEQVMGHEALSVHCFGYKMYDPEYGQVRASISFRVTLAIEKLQEQIGAELAMLPILKDCSQRT